MASEQFDIVFSPMKFSDTQREVREDMVDALPRVERATAPDVVVFSESHAFRRDDRYVRPELERRAEEAGWHLFTNKSDSSICVNPLRHTVVEETYLQVLERRNEKPGAYSEKGVARVVLLTAAGNRVSVTSQHLLTAWVDDKKPGPESRREDLTIGQIDTWVNLAEDDAAEDGIAFVVGDVNKGDAPGVGIDPDGVYARLDAAGFVTCWDDAGQYPSTHGRKGKPIDIICRYRKDLRVHFVDAGVGPLRNSDHQESWARYAIDPLPVVVPDPVVEPPARHDCPECGRRHRILQ